MKRAFIPGLIFLAACGGGGGGTGQGGNSLDCADTVNINVTIDQHQVLDPSGEFTQPNFSPTVAGDNTVNIDACNFDNDTTNDDSATTTATDNSSRTLRSDQAAYQLRLDALLNELMSGEVVTPEQAPANNQTPGPVLADSPSPVDTWGMPIGDPSICVNDYEYGQTHNCHGSPAPAVDYVSPAPDTITTNDLPEGY